MSPLGVSLARSPGSRYKGAGSSRPWWEPWLGARLAVWPWEVPAPLRGLSVSSFLRPFSARGVSASHSPRKGQWGWLTSEKIELGF